VARDYPRFDDSPDEIEPAPDASAAEETWVQYVVDSFEEDREQLDDEKEVPLPESATREIVSQVSADLGQLDEGDLAGSDTGHHDAPAGLEATVHNALASAAEILDSATAGGLRERPAAFSEADAEIVVDALRECVRRLGSSAPVIAVVTELVASPKRLEALLSIRDYPAVADTPTRGGSNDWTRRLMMAAGLLLAVGIAVPELKIPDAEVILTNELAISALLAALAALLRGR
jgi:hypothetical protein